MSYIFSLALQTAIFDALRADGAVAAEVGTAIYDAVPAGVPPAIYVQLGAELVRDASDVTGVGTAHSVTVSIIATHPGFAGIKRAAAAVSAALHDAQLGLSVGRLVSIRFERATAQRTDAASARRIDLRFRARISND